MKKFGNLLNMGPFFAWKGFFALLCLKSYFSCAFYEPRQTMQNCWAKTNFLSQTGMFWLFFVQFSLARLRTQCRWNCSKSISPLAFTESIFTGAQYVTLLEISGHRTESQIQGSVNPLEEGLSFKPDGWKFWFFYYNFGTNNKYLFQKFGKIKSNLIYAEIVQVTTIIIVSHLFAI